MTVESRQITHQNTLLARYQLGAFRRFIGIFRKRKWTIQVGMESRKQWLLYRASIVRAKNKRRTNEVNNCSTIVEQPRVCFSC